MGDVLTHEQRRFNMSRIGGKNTKPERAVRSALHERGLRFRVHRSDLPGTPDVVFPRHRVALFVHGCFWHSHGCKFSRIPQTRSEFWRGKLEATVARDHAAVAALRAAGWHVITVWECSTRGADKAILAEFWDALAAEISSSDQNWDNQAESSADPPNP